MEDIPSGIDVINVTCHNLFQAMSSRNAFLLLYVLGPFTLDPPVYYHTVCSATPRCCSGLLHVCGCATDARGCGVC